MRPASLCVHAGHRASPETKEVVAPIAQTSTFLLDDEAYARMLGGKVDEALIYTRIRNPTLDVVQRRIAALEGAESCLVFASGMAAIHSSVMSLAPKGSRIVAHQELYGLDLGPPRELPGPPRDRDRARRPERRAIARRGAREGSGGRLLREHLEPDDERRRRPGDRARRASARREARRRRDLRDPDAAAAARARRGSRGPLGDEVPRWSLRSDRGAACGSAAVLRGVFRWLQLAGGCMDPHAAFLLDRGIKTLPLRMRAHVENASRLAKALAQHPRVASVLYPGLESHASYARGQGSSPVPAACSPSS
jgi:hypothetical protein